MSRSGYSDDCDNDWRLICWRGAVKKAIEGKRGQAFFKEMLAALDAMPEKKLLSHDFITPKGVCAIGAVIKERGVNVADIDPEDDSSRYPIAKRLGIAPAMAAEIMYENDESYYYGSETPEHRYTRMREWIRSQIK